MIKWVQVQFDGYTLYSYKCKFQKVRKGNKLLVRVRGSLKLVTCIRVHKTAVPKIATAEILSDLKEFQ